MRRNSGCGSIMFWLLILLLMGVGLGMWLSTYTSPRYNFPIDLSGRTDTVTVNDTVTVTVNSENLVIPHIIEKSLDSVSIDTVNTTINGQIVESHYKITFKQ